MPKLSPATQKIRATKLIKDLQDVNGIQSQVAKKRGRTRSAISQQLKRPYVKQFMGDVLENLGVTDNALGKTLKEGLKAEKLVYIESGDDEERRRVQEHDIDFLARHKYLETALKLKGHISTTPDKEPVQILQVFKGMDPETLGAVSVVTRIERIEAVLKNQLSKKP